jgi:hypothetical protein
VKPETRYIIEAFSAVREKHALRQIMRTDVLRDPILHEMGVSAFSWIILDFDVQWTHRRPGDIDIVGGALSWQEADCLESSFDQLSREYPHWNESLRRQVAWQHAAETGGTAWPPACGFVFGIEAKCALFRNGKAHSAKPYPEDVASLREQVNGLTLLGLDRVALLDVIATEPANGSDIYAWFAARNIAEGALKAMDQVLSDRLPPYSPAGHIALSPGAVVGGDESFRGAPIVKVLRAGDVAAAGAQIPDRERLNSALQKALRAQTKPKFFPAVYVQCVECARIHSLHDDTCRFTIEQTPTASNITS